MSSRLSTRRASRSRDSSAVSSSSARSCGDQSTSLLRRLVTAAFAEARGRAQVVPDRGEQRRAHPVGLAPAVRPPRPPRPSRCRSRIDRGLRGERADDALVLGQQRPPAQGEHERVAGGHLGVGVLRALARLGAGTGHDRPRVGRAAGGRTAVGVGCRARSSSVTDVSPNASRTRSSSAGSAVSPRSTLPASVPRVSASAVARAACRVRRAARSTTELTSTATTTKTHEGQRVVRLADGERVQRRGEVVVQQQRPADGGQHGRAGTRRPGRRPRPRSRNSSTSLTRFEVLPLGAPATSVSSGGSSTAEDGALQPPAAGQAAVQPRAARGPCPICVRG